MRMVVTVKAGSYLLQNNLSFLATHATKNCSRDTTLQLALQELWANYQDKFYLQYSMETIKGSWPILKVTGTNAAFQQNRQ